MKEKLDEFKKFRDEMNKKILETDNMVIKRFFNLDTNVYKDGALPGKIKEMLGLMGSLVLRCDDCISYHILECKKHDLTKEEFFEIFSVALIVGGSITIPHIRRAVSLLFDTE